MLKLSLDENCRTSRAVGSAALNTGLYQHAACGRTEILNIGSILKACTNRSCPNKGANWTCKRKPLKHARTPVKLES